MKTPLTRLDFPIAGQWERATLVALCLACPIALAFTKSFVATSTDYVIIGLMAAIGIGISVLPFLARLRIGTAVLEIVTKERRLPVALHYVRLDEVVRTPLPADLEEALAHAHADNDGEIRFDFPRYRGDWVCDASGRNWFVVRTTHEGVLIPTSGEFDVFVTPKDIDGFLRALRVRTRLAQGAAFEPLPHAS